MLINIQTGFANFYKIIAKEYEENPQVDMSVPCFVHCMIICSFVSAWGSRDMYN